MCRLLIITFVFAAVSGSALAAQDRYGPPRAQASSAPVVTVPQSYLGWHGKAAVAPALDEASRRPPALAPWAQRLSNTPLAQPAPALPPPANAPQPMAMRAPAVAQSAPMARVAARADAAPAAGPRFYSVYREFGAQPDAIPAPTPALRGESLTLAEPPVSPQLARTTAPLDDGSGSTVPVTQTAKNAAATRTTNMGF